MPNNFKVGTCVRIQHYSETFNGQIAIITEVLSFRLELSYRLVWTAPVPVEVWDNHYRGWDWSGHFFEIIALPRDITDLEKVVFGIE